MPGQKENLMAQAVYLAQLEAQKGTCKCRTCAILRKANDAMVTQFLEERHTEPDELWKPDVVETRETEEV